MSEWTEDKVAQRFDECYSVIQRLPSGLSLGYRQYWPEIRYNARELARQKAKPIRVWLNPKAIDRAEETLTWITWVNHGERNLIWLRARRISWRGIARETGFPKTSAQRYWREALCKIVRHLEA